MLLRSLSAFLVLGTLASAAQSNSGPGYTLRANSRIVLTDVSITDRNGEPVHGLPSTSFHLSDNNHPQAIASFEEHVAPTPSTTQAVSSSSNVYSNDYLLHLPPVLNILVLDTTNLEVQDQMFLSYQLMKFLDTLPSNEMLAIYYHGGPQSVLLQGFTADRDLLKRAVSKALPHFLAMGNEYLTDIDTLQQIVRDLAQIPGRKNVLWFSGGSSLFLHPDGALDGNSTQRYVPDMRLIYDQLESSRIAVYPVDARGLTTGGGQSLTRQHFLMSEVADATGGRAIFNTNGLSEETGRILRNDGSFYTITYAPQGLQFNNKWHKVKVELDGERYNLTYRRGYFADGNAGAVSAPEKARTRLLAEGKTADLPDTRNQPIIFQAQIARTSASAPLAAGSKPPKKGSNPFNIHYSLPLHSFTRQNVNGQQKISFGVVAIAFDRNGNAVAHSAKQVSASLTAEAALSSQQLQFPVDMRLDLGKGDLFLSLSVWDIISQRTGTLQIPFQVEALEKPRH